MGDEFSDPIDKFKKTTSNNLSLVGSQFGGVDPRSPSMQQQQMSQQQMPQQQMQQMPQQQMQQMPQQMSQQQQQQMLQQQQMQQQMQQQQMQQQQLQQQQLQQQQIYQQKMQKQMKKQDSKSSLGLESFGNLKEKFESLNVSNILQELLILSVLFIIYNADFVKNLLTKIPGIKISTSGNFDTMGTIISAVLFSLIFILIRLFI